MPFDKPDRDPALDRLEPLLGAWDLEMSLPDRPRTGPIGRCVFAWTLDRRFMIQRTEIGDDGAPASMAIIGVDPGDSGDFIQHYFDERGVARIYAMKFRDGLWELVRDAPDFSPFTFSQRFIGTLDDAGDTITARWERGDDLGSMQLDFELAYTRADAYG